MASLSSRSWCPRRWIKLRVIMQRCRWLQHRKATLTWLVHYLVKVGACKDETTTNSVPQPFASWPKEASIPEHQWAMEQLLSTWHLNVVKFVRFLAELPNRPQLKSKGSVESQAPWEKKKRSSSWLNIIWPFTAFHAYNFQASTCISQPSSFRAFPPGLKFGCSAMVVALRCIDHIDKKKCLGRPNCWFAQTFKKDCADFSTWPCHLWSHSLGFAASWWVSSIKLEPLQIRSWHTMNIWHQ